VRPPLIQVSNDCNDVAINTVVEYCWDWKPCQAHDTLCVSSSGQPHPNHDVFADLCRLSRSIMFTCVRRLEWAPKIGCQNEQIGSRSHRQKFALGKAVLRPIRRAETIAPGCSCWLSNTFTCARYKQNLAHVKVFGPRGTKWHILGRNFFVFEASDRSMKDNYGPRDSRMIAAVRSDWLALVCALHATAV